ncbi:recombinase family protein [Hyphomicrobium sp. 802]|uniref:recombinase family protein n=1 Tax=Hyphomicrobium sp. 802 TaxID=1112272 RepID=UPI0032AFF27F
MSSLAIGTESKSQSISSRKAANKIRVPSPGNMERPALRRLLLDIEAGRVDTVVVYKVDRDTLAC